jgi:hypothetical protein
MRRLPSVPVEIVQESPLASSAEGYQPLLKTLTHHLDVSILDMDVAFTQPGGLGQPDPGI